LQSKLSDPNRQVRERSMNTFNLLLEMAKVRTIPMAIDEVDLASNTLGHELLEPGKPVTSIRDAGTANTKPVLLRDGVKCRPVSHSGIRGHISLGADIRLVEPKENRGAVAREVGREVANARGGTLHGNVAEFVGGEAARTP